MVPFIYYEHKQGWYKAICWLVYHLIFIRTPLFEHTAAALDNDGRVYKVGFRVYQSDTGD